MTPNQLNAKIYAGRAKVAARIGRRFNLFRPRYAVNPISLPLRAISVALNAADGKYQRPNLYGKPIWFADLDGRQTAVGDYLVALDDPTEIYFIAAMQPMLPIAVISCNRTVRITGTARLFNPATGATIGALGYSGTVEQAGKVVDIAGVDPINNGTFAGWPASIVFGGQSDRTVNPLPASNRKQVGWQILLPATIPLTITANMRITDDLGMVYIVAGAELSDLGWRIQATEVHD